jgi:hypothetical protein
LPVPVAGALEDGANGSPLPALMAVPPVKRFQRSMLVSA